MKALVLFLFRLATGGYLVAWSCSKLLNTAQAISMSDSLYFGLFSTPVMQNGLATLGAVLGIFVALGFLRGFSYSVQAVALAVPVAALGYFVSQSGFDLSRGIEASTMVLPSMGLFFLSLASLVWLKDDVLSLDRFIGWRRLGLAREAADKASLAVPLAAVAPLAAAEAVASEPEPVAEVAADIVEADIVEAGAADEDPSVHDAVDAAPEGQVSTEPETVSVVEPEPEPEHGAETEQHAEAAIDAGVTEEVADNVVTDAPVEVVVAEASPADEEIQIDPALLVQTDGHEAHSTH